LLIQRRILYLWNSVSLIKLSRSYLELSKDEIHHALALHKESIVIDASTFGFIEYVGEDLMLDDLLMGGVTASNATVCMQHNLSEARALLQNKLANL
jgi:hypothetical protein